MDADLFSFLKPTNNDELAGPSSQKKSKKKKRKLDPSESATPLEQESELNGEMDLDGPSLQVDDKAITQTEEPLPKKLRMEELLLAPLVVDEFEEEAKREVKADAGLTGGDVGGASLLLTHQVCNSK